MQAEFVDWEEEKEEKRLKTDRFSCVSWFSRAFKVQGNHVKQTWIQTFENLAHVFKQFPCLNHGHFYYIWKKNNPLLLSTCSSEAMEHVHIETYLGRLQKTSSSLENNQSSPARVDLQGMMCFRKEQITAVTKKIWLNSSCHCSRRWNKGVDLDLLNLLHWTTANTTL